MSMRQQLVTLLDRVQVRAAETAERTARNRHAVDAVLAWALERAEASGPLYYPVEYLQFLRDCTERSWAVWRELRDDTGLDRDPAARRFTGLLESLSDLPAVEFSGAERLARAADRLRANINPATGQREHGDQQRRFSRAASLGIKGRVLYTIAKVMQSEQVVELGTFVGMSAMFLLEALETAGADAHLTTVELNSDFHARASALIHSRFNGRATCINGRTQDVVPDLARTLTGVDLLFHDAGHSGEAYVRDFVAAEPFMAPGSVVLFDDIRWFDPAVVTSDPKCYDGWMEVTRHPRVRRAGEIDGYMGVVLLR
jgi:predicted O-methyltransferase YrrM